MNGIVIGNSQVGALKSGYAAVKGDMSLAFFSVPGGNGPKLKMDQSRLFAGGAQAAMSDPVDLGEMGVSLNDYDYIIYSGWGLSALRSKNAAHLLNRFTLAEMSVARPMGQQPVSRGFMTAAIRTEVGRIPGTAGLRMLRRAFDGPIIVQPFPLPTPLVLTREDCSLSEQYGAQTGAFLSWYYAAQYDALQEVSQEIGGNTVLLPYADTNWLAEGFTPKDYGMGGDCWHMNESYGELILTQVQQALTSKQA